MLSKIRTLSSISASFSLSLAMCSSISVNFPALFSSSPLILVSALSMPRNSRMSRSVLVLYWSRHFGDDFSSLSEEGDRPSPARWVSPELGPETEILTDEGVSIPSSSRASDAPKRALMVLSAKKFAVGFRNVHEFSWRFFNLEVPARQA